eukprot:TRINITY_DN27804_c0_g1_i2.p1 TRINITY_DN27804_c0_g1~~TRINITY_DN27804_c0_g1_i2.p1  ORF type:complete len:104 (+),score=14.76 TRINITY_DN27804_c0_g1_i2:219-530(+)
MHAVCFLSDCQELAIINAWLLHDAVHRPLSRMNSAASAQSRPFPRKRSDYRKSTIDVGMINARHSACLLYTSDAADEEDSVDLGGRRIIKKKKNEMKKIKKES